MPSIDSEPIRLLKTPRSPSVCINTNERYFSINTTIFFLRRGRLRNVQRLECTRRLTVLFGGHRSRWA